MFKEINLQEENLFSIFKIKLEIGFVPSEYILRFYAANFYSSTRFQSKKLK